MRYGELRRKLSRLGVVLMRQGKRHEKWYNPDTQRFTSIPRHRGEVPTGLLHRILRNLGINREGFEEA